MYLRTDDLPEVPDERWWGDHLRETRWALESSRLLADPVFHGRGVPRGDGRPVILMPGFGGGDQTMLVLAAWLRRIGYRAAHRADSSPTPAARTAPSTESSADRNAPRDPRASCGADRPQPERALRPGARPSPAGARLARDLDRRRAARDARDELSDAGGGRCRPPRRDSKRTREVAAVPHRDMRLSRSRPTSPASSRSIACA